MSRLMSVLRRWPFTIVMVLAGILPNLALHLGANYDDGGIGSVAFLTTYTLGILYTIPATIVDVLAKGSWRPWGGVLADLVALAVNVGLDLIWQSATARKEAG
ncbi:MAG: hypothetical protein AB1898_32270 [Acidobacteriota bacterium]